MQKEKSKTLFWVYAQCKDLGHRRTTPTNYKINAYNFIAKPKTWHLVAGSLNACSNLSFVFSQNGHKKKETKKVCIVRIASRVAVELTSHWLMPRGPDPDGHCGNCRGSINLSLGKNLITPKIVIAGSVGGHFDGWCLSKIAWRIINSKWFNNVSDSAPSQRLFHESGICTKQKYAPLEYHKKMFCVISSK